MLLDAAIRQTVGMSGGYGPSWERTRGRLAAARDALTNPQDEALTEYEYYVDVNELGLALDALVATAQEQHAPADIWLALAAAANEVRVGPGRSGWRCTPDSSGPT